MLPHQAAADFTDGAGEFQVTSGFAGGVAAALFQAGEKLGGIAGAGALR